jgi:hypothetical protein
MAAPSKLIRRAVVVVLLVGGFGIGLALGLRDEDRGSSSIEVNKDVRFGAQSSDFGGVQEGWAKPEAWGISMSRKQAAVVVDFDGPAAEDVLMLIEARVRLAEGQATTLLLVRFNDVEIGRWRLAGPARSLRRNFLIPGAVFNRSQTARISFEFVDGSGPAQNFGLERLWLRDAQHISEARGSLDRCTPGQLQGWAVVEDSATTVVALVNKTALSATLTNVERPDLPPHGLPADAGFVLEPSTPLPAGTTIDVRLPNGHELSGSPCRL